VKLYELAENYTALQSLALDPDTDQQAIADTLESIEGAIQEKGENIAGLLIEMEHMASIIRSEELRLAARRKTLEGRADRLKQYLQQNMELAGLDTIKTPTVTLKIQANPWRVDIEEGTKIPEAYTKIKVEPDKTALKKALESGEQIEGVRLVRDHSLRIR
jgi:hypothetical protein